MPLRIGLLGAASISKKTWAAITRAGHRVVIVGCRDVERGNAFVKECADDLSIAPELRPMVVSYEQAVSHPEVDVMYIPIPVTKREKWILLCAENGKHIVGEKPPAEDWGQLDKWLHVIHGKGLLYMDGTMLSHGVRIGIVAEEVKTLGKLTHMHANFAFNGGEGILKDIRADPTLEPRGVLGDMGWYCVRYMLHFTGFTLPTAVSGRVKERSPQGGALAFVANLEFPNNVSASFRVSFLSAEEQTFTASCTNGVLRVDDFTLPFAGDFIEYSISNHSIEATATKLSFNKRTIVKSVPEDSTYQETQLWRDVEFAIDGNVAKEAEQKRWAEMSLKTQLVIDKLGESSDHDGVLVRIAA